MTLSSETNGPSNGRPPLALMRLMSMVHFVGLISFGVAEVVQLAQHGGTGFHRATLLNAVTYLIGVNGIVAGSGHLFFPDPVADSIGWPRHTPWQWEVGLAGLGFGVPGVMASGFDRDFWLATIIMASIFLLGAAVGHVRQILRERNLSPGNAGTILYTDIAIPVFAIVLYLTY